MPAAIDRTGEVFGRWTCMEKRGRKYLCSCSCGTIKEVAASSLVTGQSTSCGCHREEFLRSLQAQKRENYFDGKLEQAGDCLEWVKSTNEWGYGTCGYNNKSWLAHRLRWTLERGEIPEGLLVLHTCDNPKCCNIDHLWLGTNADNVADMKAKGRANCLKGADSPMAKLDADEVRWIRKNYPKYTQTEMGEMFHVTQRVIGLIVNRKSYTEVTD